MVGALPWEDLGAAVGEKAGPEERAMGRIIQEVRYRSAGQWDQKRGDHFCGV